MFQDIDIQKELLELRHKNAHEGNHLIFEARRILKKDLFSDEKILQNLGAYNRSADVLDEEDLEKSRVFTLSEIKTLCTTYRLKFLDTNNYQPEFPFEAVMKVRGLNEAFRKNIKHLMLLGSNESFRKNSGKECVLFAKTNYDNYYLVHRWGTSFKWGRRLSSWPLRSFENLFFTVALITLVITIALPTTLISLDERIGYFSGFRIAAFFHLLIFNTGVTAYITFTFNKNFSSVIWDKP